MKINGFNFVLILCSILKRDCVAFPPFMGQNPANHYFKPLSNHQLLVLKLLYLLWQKIVIWEYQNSIYIALFISELGQKLINNMARETSNSKTFPIAFFFHLQFFVRVEKVHSVHQNCTSTLK